MKIFPSPINALVAFLESEKKAANLRARQCDKLLLVEIEEDVRNAIYNLRKKTNEEFSIVLRLLSLVR